MLGRLPDPYASELPDTLAQPALDDVVHEVTQSEPLVRFAADGEGGASLEREAFDAAIMAGLLVP